MCRAPACLMGFLFRGGPGDPTGRHCSLQEPRGTCHTCPGPCTSCSAPGMLCLLHLANSSHPQGSAPVLLPWTEAPTCLPTAGAHGACPARPSAALHRALTSITPGQGTLWCELWPPQSVSGNLLSFQLPVNRNHSGSSGPGKQQKQTLRGRRLSWGHRVCVFIYRAEHTELRPPVPQGRGGKPQLGHKWVTEDAELCRRGPAPGPQGRRGAVLPLLGLLHRYLYLQLCAHRGGH